MATVTVTFQDVDEGVSVRVESDPAFPGPAATVEEQNALTDAQQMGLRMTQLLTEELNQQQHAEHCHDENCTHEHHHHEPELPEEV